MERDEFFEEGDGDLFGFGSFPLPEMPGTPGVPPGTPGTPGVPPEEFLTPETTSTPTRPPPPPERPRAERTPSPTRVPERRPIAPRQLLVPSPEWEPAPEETRPSTPEEEPRPVPTSDFPGGRPGRGVISHTSALPQDPTLVPPTQRLPFQVLEDNPEELKRRNRRRERAMASRIRDRETEIRWLEHYFQSRGIEPPLWLSRDGRVSPPQYVTELARSRARITQSIRDVAKQDFPSWEKYALTLLRSSVPVAKIIQYCTLLNKKKWTEEEALGFGYRLKEAMHDAYEIMFLCMDFLDGVYPFSAYVLQIIHTEGKPYRVSYEIESKARVRSSFGERQQSEVKRPTGFVKQKLETMAETARKWIVVASGYLNGNKLGYGGPPSNLYMPRLATMGLRDNPFPSIHGTAQWSVPSRDEVRRKVVDMYLLIRRHNKLRYELIGKPRSEKWETLKDIKERISQIFMDIGMSTKVYADRFVDMTRYYRIGDHPDIGTIRKEEEEEEEGSTVRSSRASFDPENPIYYRFPLKVDEFRKEYMAHKKRLSEMQAILRMFTTEVRRIMDE